MTSHIPLYFRKGVRVGLSVPQEEDIPFYLEAMNNPEITHFLMRRFPVMRDAQEEWFRNLTKNRNTHQVFNITNLENDEHIGVMGLHDIDWIHGTATTGAWIKSDTSRGKGLGTEAKLLLLRYAFYDLNLRKIRSSVLDFNKRSRAYNEKCGYRVEGVLKEEVLIKGKPTSLVLMAVYKNDFDALCEQNQQNLPDSVDFR